MACWSVYKSRIKKCVVCSKEFKDSQSNGTVTCGKICSRIHRQQMHADGKYEESLKKAHKAAKNSPLTGRFETHMHAKNWVLQSPSGEIFECRNLKNWLRNHEYMLNGSVQQAWEGITKIKYSMLGKRKHISYQWKGWKLLNWGD